MSDSNKVLFGFSELHIGTYTVNDDGTVTMGTPYHQKGAVGFSPEADSEKSSFYADNSEYFASYSGGSREGDLEVAKFDDSFKTQFLGYKRTSGGGLAEVKNPVKPNVYIAFQVEGDKDAMKVIMYNGSLGYINREYSTTEEGIEVATETIPATFTGDSGTGITVVTYLPGDADYDTLFTNPPAPELEEESE